MRDGDWAHGGDLVVTLREVFGSAVSFGAAGQASAPGQIDAGDLRFILQVLAQD